MLAYVEGGKGLLYMLGSIIHSRMMCWHMLEGRKGLLYMLGSIIHSRMMCWHMLKEERDCCICWEASFIAG